MEKIKSLVLALFSLGLRTSCQSNRGTLVVDPLIISYDYDSYIEDCYSEGTLSFSDEGDYVRDGFGFRHEIGNTQYGKRKAVYKDSQKGKVLSKTDFKDGEKVVFGWLSYIGSFDTLGCYPNKGTTQIFKYDESLITPRKVVKLGLRTDGRVFDEKGKNFYLDADLNLEGNCFFSSDFRQTTKKYDTLYDCYRAKGPHLDSVELLVERK